MSKENGGPDRDRELTETVEQTRRALFESLQGARADKSVWVRGYNSGDYKNPVMQNRWVGFNAALDAVEIEMPKISDQPVADHYCWSSCEEKCRSAINSTNLGLRIK